MSPPSFDRLSFALTISSFELSHKCWRGLWHRLTSEELLSHCFSSIGLQLKIFSSRVRTKPHFNLKHICRQHIIDVGGQKGHAPLKIETPTKMIKAPAFFHHVCSFHVPICNMPHSQVWMLMWLNVLCSRMHLCVCEEGGLDDFESCCSALNGPQHMKPGAKPG